MFLYMLLEKPYPEGWVEGGKGKLTHLLDLNGYVSMNKVWFLQS